MDGVYIFLLLAYLGTGVIFGVADYYQQKTVFKKAISGRPQMVIAFLINLFLWYPLMLAQYFIIIYTRRAEYKKAKKDNATKDKQWQSLKDLAEQNGGIVIHDD